MNNDDLEKLLRKIVKEEVQPLNDKIDRAEQNLSKKIDKSQEEIIEALTSYIDEGHAMHEKRIEIIEEHLELDNPVKKN